LCIRFTGSDMIAFSSPHVYTHLEDCCREFICWRSPFWPNWLASWAPGLEIDLAVTQTLTQPDEDGCATGQTSSRSTSHR